MSQPSVREAVLAFLQADPDGVYAPIDITRALTAQGYQPKGWRTPLSQQVPTTLRLLAKAGLVDRPHQAMYRLAAVQ